MAAAREGGEGGGADLRCLFGAVASGTCPQAPDPRGYEHLLGRYVRPVLGRKPIDTITPSVVRTWWSRLPADKPTVRARSYELLKAVMNTAVADEVIDKQPLPHSWGGEHASGPEIRPATAR